MMPLIVLSCLLHVMWLRFLVNARTLADEHRTHIADIQLLKGAYFGKVEYVQDALAHRNTGNVNAILTREIGEYFLKLGKAKVDFPVAPALHVALSGGTRKHLQVVHLLLMRGADPNLSYDGKDSFYPALYYALGAFNSPTNSQVAVLQKMFQAYPHRFSASLTRDFVHRTGNPPPIHTAVIQNFFDGVYLFSTTSIFDINERDAQGLSALHVASWLGNLNLILLLLHNNATPNLLDRHNRSFVHYLACRGLATVFRNIFTDDTLPLSVNMKTKLLLLRDNGGRTALDIAMMPPIQIPTVTAIMSFLSKASSSIPDLNFVFPKGSVDSYCENEIALQCCNLDIADPVSYSQEMTCVQSDPFHYENLRHWNFVSTREWFKLSEEDFNSHFFFSQRPLRLIGNFTSGMKVWKFLDQEIFIKRYKASKMRLTTLTRNIEGEMISVEEYFNELSGSEKVIGDDSGNVSASKKNLVGIIDVSKGSEIYGDFTQSLKFFSICGLYPPLAGSMLLQIWPASLVYSPFRSESSFWNVLLAGSRRRWYLISPGSALNTTFKKFDRGGNSGEDMESWIQTTYPALKRMGKAVDIDQNAGDVVFVPHSWSFAVVGKGDVIDLWHNFCVVPEYNSVFGQVPVGVRMYGHR